jgi:hypothetical protein
MSWYRAPLWDLRPDITSCRNVAVWNLRSCFCGAPSLKRGRVCNLQCNHSMVLWDLRPDITSCRNVSVWNLRSCICGVPSLTRGRVCSYCWASPAESFSGLSPSKSWPYRSRSRNYFTTDGQSVSMSWCRAPFWGPWPDFTFFFLLPENCFALRRSRSYFTTDSQSVSQSVCLGIEHPCGTCDQILLPVGMLLSEICGLVSMECPLWREDGSAICSVITQWSESRRARNHTLLSHLRLPNLEGQVPVFISPRNRVAQLYPRALGSLYAASYDSQC